MNPVVYHEPVLLNEVVQYLITDPDGTYVDATTGGGGHAAALARMLGPRGKLICCDADDDALRAAQQVVGSANALFLHTNFRDLKRELAALSIGAVSGILFDLGVSSYQLDEGSRGFSFRADEPLDMRMDRRQKTNARHVVNLYEEKKLASIIAAYGEERQARRIAARIVRSRPLETTGALREAVAAAVGGRFLIKSLARVFQAIRIEVNRELENLQQALLDVTGLLEPSGRVVVISYHSLEDRIVKEFLKSEAAGSIPSGNKLMPDTLVEPRLRLLTRKPVVPEPDELRRNPRSRSAKLRAAERLGKRTAG